MSTIILIDPRASDSPHSLARHRPDLPTTDAQVDGQWSFADAPGGWYAPPTTVPEPSTVVLLMMGGILLAALTKWRKRYEIRDQAE